MRKQKTVKLSKLLSYVLRHRPDAVGLELGPGGWVDVEMLLEGLAAHQDPISREELEEIVRTCDKQRFALSPDGLSIRANQGHSAPVDLGYEPRSPPEVLFHGTVRRFLASIRAQGLLRGQRHHVHLSSSVETAKQVGGRRGRPVVLEVRACEMVQDGHVFYVSPNGVWLTEHVPPRYIDFPPE